MMAMAMMMKMTMMTEVSVSLKACFDSCCGYWPCMCKDGCTCTLHSAM